MSTPVLLCLHGWGGSKESFTELREALKGKDIRMLTPDLPGFGDEPEPQKAWQNDDYVEWVIEYLKKQGMGNGEWGIHILGHSHGGRIAIKLATQIPNPESRIPIAHLYLCAAAGIKHPRHIKRALGLTLAKTGKFFLSIPGLKLLQPLGKKLLYKLVRVHDYEKASPVMRQTLINVSQEDLRPLLKDVNIPTDIFWGKDDGMTPFGDALIMEKEISGSQLHPFQGMRHRVHRDRAPQIAEVILRRMSGDSCAS